MLLAAQNCTWPPRIAHGHVELHLATHNCIWPCIIAPGHAKLHLAAQNCTWPRRIALGHKESSWPQNFESVIKLVLYKNPKKYCKNNLRYDLSLWCLIWTPQKSFLFIRHQLPTRKNQGRKGSTYLLSFAHLQDVLSSFFFFK